MAARQELPQVELDTTLAELYARGRSKSEHERIALVLAIGLSEVAHTSKFPRNSKYLFQEYSFITTPQQITSEQHKELQHVAALKYLTLVPQRDAFIAGNMPVFLFNLDASEGGEARSKQEAKRSISTLKTHQRPEVLLAASPSQIAPEANHIDLLAAKLPLDGLEGFRLASEIDTHYFLNTNAALCASGLTVPESVQLELNGISGDPISCCTACREAVGNFLIPGNCTGTRGQWLNSQITQVLSRLSSQQLPFVLKCQQTFGGGATWIITTEGELRKLKATLANLVLPKLYSQVNSSNAHLKPATLIISEMVRDPIADWAINLFVTKTGECIFLSAAQQVFNSTKSWLGSTVAYTAQASLKEKFTPTMNKIGAWLHKHGYYGPCGADILETAPTDDKSDESSNLYVVDLNVRSTASTMLGLMKGHFSDRRGLHEAISFSLRVNMTRDAFITKFIDFFREGKIIIVAWYEEEASSVSSGIIVIGARNRLELENQVAMIKEVGTEIHY